MADNQFTQPPVVGTIIPNDVQEVQTWMPYGDKGADNFPSLQDYIDSPIREDGALMGSLADCKSYNKVLNQVTKVVVGLARYINALGLPVRDTDSEYAIRDKLIEAVRTHIMEVFSPSDGTAAFEGNFNYTQKVIILETRAPIGASIGVLPYTPGVTPQLVFFEGFLVQKGKETDEKGTPSWYEVEAERGGESSTIRFNFTAPAGARIVVLRFGAVTYTRK